jgi:hypothetical protein
VRDTRVEQLRMETDIHKIALDQQLTETTPWENVDSAA